MNPKKLRNALILYAVLIVICVVAGLLYFFLSGATFGFERALPRFTGFATDM